MHANSLRIDFETWASWHERKKLLKVAFPVATGPNIEISQPAIHVQSLKCAEDGSGDVILRLIDLYGARGVTKISLMPGVDFKNATYTNMLEDARNALEIVNGAVFVSYKPFEIITLHFKPNKP